MNDVKEFNFENNILFVKNENLKFLIVNFVENENLQFDKKDLNFVIFVKDYFEIFHYKINKI